MNVDQTGTNPGRVVRLCSCFPPTGDKSPIPIIAMEVNVVSCKHTKAYGGRRRVYVWSSPATEWVEGSLAAILRAVLHPEGCAAEGKLLLVRAGRTLHRRV